MPRENASAESRRRDIIAAAIDVFAETGYYRATTAQVAERATISQPYVYRFFTKESLLVEALNVSWERILEAFDGVIASAPSERLEDELNHAYESIMQAHRNEILLQMQAQTITEDPVRACMRDGMERIRRRVLDAFTAAGLEEAELRASNFLARGLLCNLSMALEMPGLMEKKPRV